MATAPQNVAIESCAQIQIGEQEGDGRHVADEPAHWPGEFFDERWCRNDLVGARQLGLLIDIDHLQCAVVL